MVSGRYTQRVGFFKMNITKLLFSLNSVGECSSVQSSQKVRPVHKGIRMLSDSETEASPVKLDLSLADGTKKKVKFPANPDIHGAAGYPQVIIVFHKDYFLQNSFQR